MQTGRPEPKYKNTIKDYLQTDAVSRNIVMESI